jgi:ABC-type uncharacterized transport system permease subunit
MCVHVILFILLVPGVLVTLPYKGNKWTAIIFHALLFGIIISIIHAVNDTVIEPNQHIKGYYEFNCRA